MNRTSTSVSVVVALVIGLFWSTAAHAGSPLPQAAAAAGSSTSRTSAPWVTSSTNTGGGSLRVNTTSSTQQC